ncbi:hypothetical protein NXS15_01265 [Mycoplasma sp. CSL7475-4]|uniref:hypothetical protein n=1 Tax=Mycoplasma sp. CSL7475-4 TaxID=2973942 RepID=UPI00216B4B49|nr:hypothetical protein [Mycoplasma sp. CSL7475-4]MCS4536760.1 hypothetical protein [Mycoplasma sp. CSL7475-4]
MSKDIELNYTEREFWTWLRYSNKTPELVFAHEYFSHPVEILVQEFGEVVNDPKQWGTKLKKISNYNNLDIIDKETLELVYPILKFKKFKKRFWRDYALHNWIMFQSHKVNEIKALNKHIRTYQKNYANTKIEFLKIRVKKWKTHDGRYEPLREIIDMETKNDT